MANPDAPTLSHILPFPAFGCDWVSQRSLIIPGGGGASKTGIPNGVVLYEIGEDIKDLKEEGRYDTADELPYFAKAMPSLGLIAVAISNRVELVRLNGMEHLIKVMEVETATNQDPVMVAAFSNDGSRLAVGAHDGLIHVFHLHVTYPGTVNTQVRLKPAFQVASEATGRPYRALTFHPNNRHLLGSCEDGAWRVWFCKSFNELVAARGGGHNEDDEGREELELETMLPATVQSDINASLQGVLYTCRCGNFSVDGTRLYTIHYVRRGPKNADKRPYLTWWNVSEHPERPGKLNIVLVKSIPVGTEPIMCLDLSQDGKLGFAGDSEGRTILFNTETLVWTSRANMHNFGVTGIVIAPHYDSISNGVTGAGGGEDNHPTATPAASSSPLLLIASSSGDKTLRLQFHDPTPKQPTSWLSTLIYYRFYVFFWAFFVLALALIVHAVIRVLYNISWDRCLDVWYYGHYEPTIWQHIFGQPFDPARDL